jgi:hypothetical protein
MSGSPSILTASDRLLVDFRLSHDHAPEGERLMLEIRNTSPSAWTLRGQEGTLPTTGAVFNVVELHFRPGILFVPSPDRQYVTDRSWLPTFRRRSDGTVSIRLVPRSPLRLGSGESISVTLTLTEGLHFDPAGGDRSSQVQLVCEHLHDGIPQPPVTRIHQLKLLGYQTPRQELPFMRARASSQVNEPYNGKPRSADRLIEYPKTDGTFWSSVPGADPEPWFWLELNGPTFIRSLVLAWGAGRPASYRVLSSMDGQTWADTGVSHCWKSPRSQAIPIPRELDPGALLSYAADELPGWPGLTRFIKVETVAKDYVSCYYARVTGMWWASG